ncbi:MAG: trypsin-like peptidase domain-containing protein [Nitrincola lacisaponensis]|uniref:Outer membrane stress sensor protease DegS n=1 Tax=Nitrincola lacisaponensis TaxID=267850 RepID=A0A063Y537_9GAMM|nr:trypsin-like peptidase domain-containing protein [Nitrincola lacisaponensis]KDE40789.1 Outer membrane stress sensor protease DegS [Nitrincola lacisaponensis]
MGKFKLLSWPVTTGILAALLIIQFFFDPSAMQRITTVEILETQTQPAQQERAVPMRLSYADAVDRASPAVVNIYTQTVVRQPANPLLSDPLFQQFFNIDRLPQQERIQSSLGSGVILSPQGYVVTNNHVISGADSIVVSLQDGREALAEVIGSDPETDLALLKIGLPNLPSIILNTSDVLRVGDVVLAIGNPFGVGQTVTQGIVSATGRNSIGLTTYENFIQTDAAINPGNSGGALIDPNGHLVGINTAIFSQSGGSHGIGFAIPAITARQVMQDLIEHGRVIRGWLGIEVQELTPQLAESFNLESSHGVIVSGIVRNGPAHRAGLEPGDILLAINSETITTGRDLMRRIARTKPGETVRFEVLRNDRKLSLLAEMSERAQPAR